MAAVKVFLLLLFFVLSVVLIDLAVTASMNGREEFLIPAFALPFLIMLLYYTVSALKSYRRVKNLHRCGERTTGKMVEFEGQQSARHARILYHDADGAGHVCITYWLRRSLKKGADVSVLYEPGNPRNSCVEKYDLIFTVLLFYCSAVLFSALLAATVIGTIWFCH